MDLVPILNNVRVFEIASLDNDKALLLLGSDNCSDKLILNPIFPMASMGNV